MKVNVAARDESTGKQIMAELSADNEKQIVQLVCAGLELDLGIAESFCNLSEFLDFSHEAEISFIYNRLD